MKYVFININFQIYNHSLTLFRNYQHHKLLVKPRSNVCCCLYLPVAKNLSHIKIICADSNVVKSNIQSRMYQVLNLKSISIISIKILVGLLVFFFYRKILYWLWYDHMEWTGSSTCNNKKIGNLLITRLIWFSVFHLKII